jgi:hypothetical protein
MAERDDLLRDLETAMHRFGKAWEIGDLATLHALLSPTYAHSDATG